MSIEKINLNTGHFTPDSEKDLLESAHISDDELTVVKNENKIVEHSRIKDIEEKLEDKDLLPTKEGHHVDQWRKGKNDRSMNKFESPNQIARQNAIRDAREKSFESKAL